MKKLFAAVALAIAGVLLAPAIAQAAFGIDPGKVYVDNLYPGANGEYSITVVNQGDEEATFSATARQPDYTNEGYEPFTNLDWISIKPERLTISAKSKGQFLVTVTMPRKSNYTGKKAEVWISFREMDTPGMIKIEIASRLFISTSPGGKPVTSTPGSVGITAEPARPAGSETTASGPDWGVIGRALIVISLVSGIVFLVIMIKRRRPLSPQ